MFFPRAPLQSPYYLIRKVAVCFEHSCRSVSAELNTRIIFHVRNIFTKRLYGVFKPYSHAGAVKAFFVVFFLSLLAVGCAAPVEERELFGTDPGVDGIVFNVAGKPGFQSVELIRDGVGSGAIFNGPDGLALNGLDLYVADTINNSIRKIDLLTKEVTTIAGSASPIGGYRDGPGSTAAFDQPVGIFYHAGRESLFIADRGNNVIREMSTKAPGYFVSTLAGNPDASADQSAEDGVGNNVVFAAIVAITGDDENLYVVDKHSIRKVIIATRQVITIAGITESGGISDGSGHLIDSDDISSFDGVARFCLPTGITTLGDDLFIAGSRNNTIRRLRLSQIPVLIKTVAGSPPFDELSILSDDVPSEEAACDEITSGGTRPPFDQAPKDGFATAARFSFPVGIVSDGTYLFIADSGGGGAIRRYHLQDKSVETIAGGSGRRGFVEGAIGFDAEFSTPKGLAISSSGDALYVANSTFNHIAVVR